MVWIYISQMTISSQYLHAWNVLLARCSPFTGVFFQGLQLINYLSVPPPFTLYYFCPQLPSGWGCAGCAIREWVLKPFHCLHSQTNPTQYLPYPFRSSKAEAKIELDRQEIRYGTIWGGWRGGSQGKWGEAPRSSADLTGHLQGKGRKETGRKSVMLWHGVVGSPWVH